MKRLWITVLGLNLAAFGCGPEPQQEEYADESKSTTFTSGAAGGSSEPLTAKIPIVVDYGAFGLATAALNYTVTLDDDPAGDPGGASTCLSGYTATVDETNLDGIEVYLDDRNCLAKLTSLTTAAGTYTSTAVGATNFTTWAANDTAIFSDGAGGTIRVKVISQLASPTTGTEAIVYNFSEVLDATDDYTFSEADVSTAASITVESLDAPPFTIAAATYVGADDITGAPELSFKMECVDDPAAVSPTSIAMTDGDASNSLCGTTELADIDYKLVLDSYGSTLTLAQAEAIFSTAGSTITLPADQYADGPTNEGFNTITLDGPGPLGTAGNENMILILRAGISYTYFNVDITTIVQ